MVLGPLATKSSPCFLRSDGGTLTRTNSIRKVFLRPKHLPSRSRSVWTLQMRLSQTYSRWALRSTMSLACKSWKGWLRTKWRCLWRETRRTLASRISTGLMKLIRTWPSRWTYRLMADPQIPIRIFRPWWDMSTFESPWWSVSNVNLWSNWTNLVCRSIRRRDNQSPL